MHLYSQVVRPAKALTFVLSWGAIALLMVFYDQIVALFGERSETNLVFILAVYSPGIAGVFLVWRHYGLQGLGSFIRRLTLWRVPLHWWLFIIVCIPAIVYAAAAAKGSMSIALPVIRFC